MRGHGLRGHSVKLRDFSQLHWFRHFCKFRLKSGERVPHRGLWTCSWWAATKVERRVHLLHCSGVKVRVWRGQLCWCASGAVSLPRLASPSRSRAQVHARADLRAWAADAQESLEIEVPPIESGKRASVCRSLLDQFGPGKILPWTPNTCLSA